MRTASLAGIIALILLAAQSPAAARSIPDGGMTLQDIVNWLQAEGYKAEVQYSADGRPNVASAANGENFHISQYDCKGDVCGSLQFWVGFNTKGAFSAERINEWNRKNRWLRAYIDDVNDPWLEMDVDLTPGGSYENLNDEFAIWRDGLRRFHSENSL